MDHAAGVAVDDVLALAKGERVLLVTHPDPEVSRVALAVHDAVVKAGADPVLVATQPRRGADLADPVLIRALESDPEVLILLTRGRIGGDQQRLRRPVHGTYTHYLQYLLSEAPTRGFWAAGVTRAAFAKGVAVDYDALRSNADSLKMRLQEAVELRIATGKDMDLVVPVEGAMVRTETGDYRSPGATGELPSGELVVPVVEGATSGRLRVTGGMSLPEESVVHKDPVEVHVGEGRLEKVVGDDAARRLEATLAGGERLADQAVREGWLTRQEAQTFASGTHQVKEVAFGLNPGLKARGDLCGDLKALGMVRLVVGAGLREYPPGAPVSVELLVPGAKVTVVGEDGRETPLLAGGRFMREQVAIR